jgi:hypothetical protein
MTVEIVTCQHEACEREATAYWWVKVDDRQVERLFCYAHSDAEHQADLLAFGHQNLVPGSVE